METIRFRDLCNFSDKQLEAHEAVKNYKYLLYGGAMGGGKSYWLRWETAWWLAKLTKKYGITGIVGGLFCEDYPSLKDRQVSKISREFPDWLGEMHADHKEYGRCFLAKPEYGSWVMALRNLDDASKYKSAEFAVISIDELTKNQKEVFDDLSKTRLRWPGISSDDCKFFGGTNPGEIGHAWVKKWWIDKDFEPEMEKKANQFFYIPAKAADNSHLDEKYYEDLDSLPDDKRKAYRDGDWNIFKGQYFSEWRNDVHVVKPIFLPAHWRRFICGDYGYSAPSAIYWCAIDEDGVVYVYRELYVTNHTYEQLMEKVVSLTPDNEKLDYMVFDPAIWAKKGDSELSGAEKMQFKFKELKKQSINLQQGNNDRVIGWGQVREYLKPFVRNGLQLAKLQVFENCVNLIRTLPGLVYDKNRVEDVDSDGEDHAGDAIRYGIMSRPRATIKREGVIKKKRKTGGGYSLRAA